MSTCRNPSILLFLFIGIFLSSRSVFGEFPETPQYDNAVGLIQNCADPFILKHDDVYYLYCSAGLRERGIRVYRSTNLVDWGEPVGYHDGQALRSQDVWGERNFWAPEVYFLNGKFYMFLAIQERIAVAESDSPLGPFIQKEQEQKPFEPDLLKIDPHLFIDDDGEKYFYFVRFNRGNEIWVAKLNDDLHSIDESTLKLCLEASQDWENSRMEPAPGERINEGAFILKHKGVYYLTYSANNTVNPEYGVGYATSDHPMGPWKKFSGNPILKRDGTTINGPGHHSFIHSPSGHLYMVYHTHYNMERMQPRKLAIDPCEFVPNPDGGLDILKVDGPSIGKQRIL
ncbi:MAG: glycoside hydrolase family 43 protein [Planctomycetaceae bacterium]|jgi:beta-xylosidase|nr:glycoside hydrolase family 43 protein [Planctomycetaceae bacterium]